MLRYMGLNTYRRSPHQSHEAAKALLSFGHCQNKDSSLQTSGVFLYWDVISSLRVVLVSWSVYLCSDCACSREDQSARRRFWECQASWSMLG